MKLARLRWEILDLLGYVFCEASFRWWGLFDDTPLEDYPTRWDTITYLIGVPSYTVGCFFYNLQDDDAAGVTVTPTGVEYDDDKSG